MALINLDRVIQLASDVYQDMQTIERSEVSPDAWAALEAWREDMAELIDHLEGNGDHE